MFSIEINRKKNCSISINFCLGHLEHEIALLDEDLSAKESGSVVCETKVITGLPSGQIEVVEVVLPVQIKLSSLLVVSVHLYKVIHGVPRHVNVVKTYLPLRKLRGP